MALFRTETRILLIGLLFLGGIGAVVGKLWWVQVARHNYYVQKIRGNSEVTVRIPSVRGEIRDRGGLPLATNRASYELDFYLPEMVRGYSSAFGALPRRTRQYTVKGQLREGQEIDINQVVQDTVAPRLEEAGITQEYNAVTLQTHYRNDTLVPFTFMEDLTFNDLAKLGERDLGLPGVDMSVKPVRQYIYGALAAHVLGYVGPVDTDKPDIRAEAKNFTFYQADVEGKNNVEALMDPYLRGKPGIRHVRRNEKGVIQGDIRVTPPTPGANVYLTIDGRIQAIVEDALRVVGRGAAVVVNPNNGDVLAMASVPSFDPNTFIPSIPAADWRALILDETNPLTNRAILSYAPGSTFKTVTSLAGLHKGNAALRFTCTGGVTYGNKYMKCWDTHGHGNLGLTDAIKVSCNAFFYQWGNAAGIDQIDTVGKMLGIGEMSGIGLTNESPGILPGPDWLKAHSPNDRWSNGYTANVAIGQGSVQASPLQMSMVVSTLANGGTCYYPRLVDKVVEGEGANAKIVYQPPVRVRTNLLEQGLTPEMIDMVRKGMWRVVNEDGGTASRARLKGVEVAGKTGTAQFWRKGQKDNHTWFLCFAPFKEPKYAVVVFLQGAKSGGGTAAPIAAHILEQCLLLDKGFSPEIKPLPPAPGNFLFVQSVDFKSHTSGLVLTAKAVPVGPAEEDTTDTATDATSQSSTTDDRDHQEMPRPNVKSEPDVLVAAPNPQKAIPASVAKASAVVAPRGVVPIAVQVNPATMSGRAGRREGSFVQSLKNFFRREEPDNTDHPASDQDLRRQQRDLRRERDQQRHQQMNETLNPVPSPSPSPTPKKKVAIAG